MSENGTEDFSGTSSFQGSCAGIERVRGGRDIVDKPNVFFRDEDMVLLRDGEGIFDIFFPGSGIGHSLLWQRESVTQKTFSVERDRCSW